MSVLLVAPDGLLRRALAQQFRDRHRLYDVVDSAEAAIAALNVAADRYLLVLDATLPAEMQKDRGGEFELAGQKALWEQAARLNLRLVLLSDGRVFDGRSQPDWAETETAKPGSKTGVQVLMAERALAKAAPDHLILRLGAVFGEFGNNPLTRILNGLRAGEELPLGSLLKTAPTPAADVARVASAMLDQLLVGAECSGVYHYNSGGAVTPLEFAEVVYAHAGQHIDLSGAAPTLRACQRDSLFSPLVPVLRCQRLHDDFGIKRLPWRSWLPMAVKKLCEDQTK